MQLSFKQVTRQTRLLNHSMAQAFTLMRMNKVELLGHLSEMMGENPFLEADRGTFDFPTTRSRGSSAEHYDTMVDTRGSLYSHIADQLPLIFETDHAHRIALAFLSEIEPSGWLGVTVAQLAETYDLPLETCAAVLTRLQTVEPAGLFARDLKECLRLQAIDRRLLDEVMGKVIDNLDALMGCDVLTLASRLKANPADVVRCLDNIRRMDPKPGTAFEADETLLRESDVTVAIIGTDLAIELNSSSFPTVRLSDAFQTSGPIKSGLDEQHLTMIHDAKSLKSALELRNSTTMAVVTAICLRQRDFLKHGYSALRPMRMSDVAEDTAVSEATISRVLSGLLMQCPQGNVAAKSLFCAPVSYGSLPQTKHVALEMIKSLIASENASSPLSDGDIANMVQHSGLSLSRRTVAKYRQSLGLSAPPIRKKSAQLAALSISARQVTVANAVK